MVMTKVLLVLAVALCLCTDKPFISDDDFVHALKDLEQDVNAGAASTAQPEQTTMTSEPTTENVIEPIVKAMKEKIDKGMDKKKVYEWGAEEFKKHLEKETIKKSKMFNKQVGIMANFLIQEIKEHTLICMEEIRDAMIKYGLSEFAQRVSKMIEQVRNQSNGSSPFSRRLSPTGTTSGVAKDALRPTRYWRWTTPY